MRLDVGYIVFGFLCSSPRPSFLAEKMSYTTRGRRFKSDENDVPLKSGSFTSDEDGIILDALDEGLKPKTIFERFFKGGKRSQSHVTNRIATLRKRVKKESPTGDSKGTGARS